ncbi:tyrosine-type recombinase/integrase [Heyndrickxia sp. NPDC080065]
MEKALFEFMFSTGCRFGEIVTLNKNNINWSNHSVIVRGKKRQA